MNAGPGKVDTSWFPEVVHYLDERWICLVAFPAGVHGEGDRRDLTVISAAGAERRPFVQYDAGPDPEQGTWHRGDYCPETRIRLGLPDSGGQRDDPVKAALARAHRTPDGELCAIDHPRPGGICSGTGPAADWHEPPLTADQQELLAVLTVGTGDPDMPGRKIIVGERSVFEAALAVTSAEPVWIMSGIRGHAIAVIIPAQDWHAPGTCCCKNCPWQGNHGTEKDHD